MNRKLLALIMILTIILTSITGCNNLNVTNSVTQANQENIKKEEVPYYSITNAYNDHTKNHYMELNAKIPKIESSTEGDDELIDPINKEMYDNLTKLLKEASENAKTTYDTYLDTAKTNIIDERTKKLDALKSKYKNIISTDEVKAISEIKNTELDYDDDDTIIGIKKTKVDIIDTDAATPSELSIVHIEVGEVKAKDIEVDGFTSTDDLIIPGLHNKKIIVVESTAKSDTTESTTADSSMKQATISIEGRPGFDVEGIAPPEMKDGEMPEPPKDFKAKFASASNAASKKAEATKETEKESEIKKVDLIITDDVQSETTDEELTLEGFYKELDEIKAIRIPSIAELKKQYIPTTIDCDFDVKCLDENYISLFIELSESRATSSIKRFSYNIDLNQKKIINLKDILGDTYKETCVNAVKNDIESWSSDMKSLLLSDYNIDNCITEDTAFFINNNHNVVIELDKHSITVGAAGYLEFQIDATNK